MMNFTDFLISVAIIDVIILVAVAFLWYHADRQIEEYKKRAGQK